MDIARLALAITLGGAFIVMGVLHFRPGPARAMAAIIPPRLRGQGLLSAKNLVILTGVCEIVGGIGLLFPITRAPAAIALCVFLVAVFPANAYAAKHPEKFGRLAIPFWPRLTAQLVLMALLIVVAL
ncbi:MAG: DoxX family membrane protein [Microbacteriaceae bacterium]